MDDPTTSGVTEGFGLMYYGARFYDPSLGRFAQADTVVPGGVQGYDRYAYSNNNPVRYIDPSGHFAETAALTLGFGLGLGLGDALATLATAAIAVVTSPAFITAVVVIAIVAVVAVAAVVAYDLITDDQVVGVQIEGEGTPDNPNPCLFCGLSKYPMWVAGGIAAGYGAAAVCDGIASANNADSCIDAFSNNDQEPDTMPTSTPSSDSNSATTPTPTPTSTPPPSTSEPLLPTPNLSCRLTLTCSISTPGTLETR